MKKQLFHTERVLLTEQTPWSMCLIFSAGAFLPGSILLCYLLHFLGLPSSFLGPIRDEVGFSWFQVPVVLFLSVFTLVFLSPSTAKSQLSFDTVQNAFVSSHRFLFWTRKTVVPLSEIQTVQTTKVRGQRGGTFWELEVTTQENKSIELWTFSEQVEAWTWVETIRSLCQRTYIPPSH